jgi:hypothetical protein
MLTRPASCSTFISTANDAASNAKMVNTDKTAINATPRCD